MVAGIVAWLALLAAPLLYLKSWFDEIHYGERQFSKRCQGEGGLKVFESNTNVRGLLVQGSPDDCHHCEYLVTRRYKFIEFEPIQDADRFVQGDPFGYRLIRLTPGISGECRKTQISYFDVHTAAPGGCISIAHTNESRAEVHERIESAKGTLTDEWTEYRDAKDGRLLARRLWFKWENKNMIVMPDGYLGWYACSKSPNELLTQFLIPAR